MQSFLTQDYIVLHFTYFATGHQHCNSCTVKLLTGNTRSFFLHYIMNHIILEQNCEFCVIRLRRNCDCASWLNYTVEVGTMSKGRNDIDNKSAHGVLRYPR